MSTKYLSNRPGASSMGSPPAEVTVTHPFHPLRGEKLKVVRALRGKHSHLVILRSPDGKNMRIRRDWTDYDGVQGDQENLSSPLSLDIKGLREAVIIVELLKKLPRNSNG